MRTEFRSFVMRISSRPMSGSSPQNVMRCWPTVNGNTVWVSVESFESETLNPPGQLTTVHRQPYVQAP